MSDPYCPPFVPMREVLRPCSIGDWRLQYVKVLPGFVREAQAEAEEKHNWFEIADLVPAVYVRLMHENTLWMSDQPVERRTMLPLLDGARGTVLLGGLGIGCVLVPLARLTRVRHIIVLEKSPEIIAMVWPQVRDYLSQSGAEKIEVIEADAYQYQPNQGLDTVYMDIWPSWYRDNSEGIAEIRRRYEPYLSPNGWLGCWSYAHQVLVGRMQ